MKPTAYLLATIAILLNVYRSGIYIRPTNTDTQVYFGVHVVAWILFSLILTWILKRVFTWRHWYTDKEKRAAWVYVQIVYVVIAGSFMRADVYMWFKILTATHIPTRDYIETYTTANLSQLRPTSTISLRADPDDAQSSTNDEITPNAGVLGATLAIEVLENGKPFVSGTGVYLGKGVVLTNHHVVEEFVNDPATYEALACVTLALNALPDCRHAVMPTPSTDGEYFGTPAFAAEQDLALLYFDKVLYDDNWVSWTQVPEEAYGTSEVSFSSYLHDYDGLKVGDRVYTIGYPDYGHNIAILTEGIVQGFIASEEEGKPLLVSDIKFASGNSGGPVFDREGKFVGIAVACYLMNDSDNCVAGIIIPLPTIEAWYTEVTTGVDT